MSAQPLFQVDGATEGTTQWKAETLQLINWGGFHGYHSTRISPTSTLLSGPSGSGKSSLLDAYLALMMPSDTPFNGASNDATVGRARSVDQRNLISYLRGKTDSTREGDTGLLRDQVLRGDASSTWGAIAVTLVDDHQRRYTVLRAYLVPKHAVRFDDITMKMATKDGTIDIRTLGELAGDKFDKRLMKNRFPDVTVHDSYTKFADALQTKLGIGSHGDGDKALALLARIQGGQPVRSVDGLYKSMVLEEPSTYAAADTALAHFVDLEESYDAMLTEDQKATVLERIPSLFADWQTASTEMDAIDTFGANRSGDTPFLLWCLRTERALLDVAVDENRRARSQAETDFTSAREREVSLDGRLADVVQLLRDNGGDALEQLDRDLVGLSLHRDRVVAAKATFEHRTSTLGLTVSSADQFAQARQAAQDFLTTFDERERTVNTERERLQRERYPLEVKLRELDEDEKGLIGREGLVTGRLHQARVLVAEALGVPFEQLPFAAELMDLAPTENRWRKAAEVTLASVARIMLVDENLLEKMSRVIDPLRLPARINFEGVALRPHREVVADPDYISGKLVFKVSEFSGWLQERVTGRNADALCVDRPADLAGGGRRVTLNGQTRSGRSGSHGETGAPNIIGFSNKARLVEIRTQLAELRERLTDLAGRVSALSEQATELRRGKEAHQYVLDTDWPSIDLDAVDAATAATQADRERILSADSQLSELHRRHEQLVAELDAARSDKHLAAQSRRTLDSEHEKLVDRQDDGSRILDRIEDTQSAMLTDVDTRRLDEAFAQVGEPDSLAALEGGLVRLRSHLHEAGRKHRLEAAKAEASLCAAFQTFQDRWPSPNLGVTLQSYPDYLEIYTTIVDTGLRDRRQEWTRRLSVWSGQDLVPLNGSFDDAIEDIEDRLRPVNEILSTLPFGAGRDRLRIQLRRLANEDLKRFRQELKFLSSGVTEDLTDDEAEERFHKLRAFMAKIAKPEPGSKATAARDYLLDVRKHVDVTAVRVSLTGQELSTYSSLGGKSGGETQELVAFIVGAALRFQLGDESHSRPRFAPVFLDEGFVKSDSEFAGRAVSAWKELGFQLIVGAPLDKVTALEPHMDLVLSMTKNTRTGYSYITELSSPPEDGAE